MREKIGEKSLSNENEMGKDSGVEEKEVLEYEKQRVVRIRENKARMEALGLRSLASSLLSSVEKQKGKVKREDDDEYEPSDEEGEDRVSSSSEYGEEHGDSDDDFSFKNRGSSSSRRSSSVCKGKKESSSNIKQKKKRSSAQENISGPQYIDDDEALRQAIALSLESSATAKASDTVTANPCKSFGTEEVDANLSERTKGLQAQEYDKRKKRRKVATNRVQMTEDEVIVHFCNFDASGKGSITLKDLNRIATAHDFTWSDKDLDDMIRFFDSDSDGKLTLEDFKKIVYRCNMIRDPQLA